MAGEKSKKRNVIEISSSQESDSSLPESDGDDVKEINSSTSCGDDDDEYYDYDNEDNDDSECDSENEEHDQAKVDEYKECDDVYVDKDEECDDPYVDKDDEESMYNKVVQFIRGASDLQALKLVECKTYLRRHGLRLSGTKEECIDRIKEHWRLKDGNGEAFYPRSSFTINCTGDVCKGDVVLFNQKVYETFDKMTRRGHILGRRTVAGRIIKESYGVAKQQHTFTVEVLWSRGTKKLAPLFPLLVKGRNLYKLKTFRQRWKNEKERLEVLHEKHIRGAAARTVRAMRKTKAEMKKNKGAKRSKHSHDLGPSAKTKTTNEKKHRVNGQGKVLGRNNILNRQSSAHFQASSSKQNGNFIGHQNLIQSSQVREPPFLPHNYPSQNFNHFESDIFGRELHGYPSQRGSASTARLPNYHPHPNSLIRPVSQFHEFSRGGLIYPAFSHSSHPHESRNFNHFPRVMDFHQSFYSSPTETHRWR